MKFYSTSEKETFNYALSISNKIKPGDIFLVNGELGVGKSVFIRGIARGLGICDPMPSPSFTIINEYQGKIPIYHFDLYRIKDQFELYEIGFEDYIYSNGVSLIEWPEKAGDLMPETGVIVNINLCGDDREIEIIWKL